MRHLILILIAASAATAADYTLPSARLTDWTPGVTVGVPGGIDQYRPGGANQRTTLIDVTQSPYNADNTGATNAASAVQSAINAATSGQVVYLPAGTYRFDSGVGVGHKDNITIRGAGMTQTLINFYGGSGAAIKAGGDEIDYQWNFPNAAFSGNKGDTVLPCADTSQIVIGAITHLQILNSTSATTPVISVSGFPAVRRQKTRITAKTGSTVTIFPGLAFDCPSGLSPKIMQASVQAEFIGIESLAVNNINSSSPNPAVDLSVCYASWFYEVKAINVENYNLGIGDSVQCEVRRCIGMSRRQAGSNGAALLTAAIGSCLFEDNIFGQNFPTIEFNHGSTGNVFAYNFVFDSVVFGSAAAAIDTNHSPHNSYNLFEGNIAPNVQCDGYFGGASEDTVFRNWLHGRCDTTNSASPGLTVNFNRFTRNYSVVGNILGSNNLTSFIYPEGAAQWGMPNMGNFAWEGEAQPSVGDWWADFGTSPGTGGFQELDLDVFPTTIFKANYSTETDSIISGESIGSDTLPNSLFRSSKPAYFGNLAWPPINSLSPFNAELTNANFARIPAGYRYVNGTDPPPDGGGSSIQTLNVQNLRIGQ